MCLCPINVQESVSELVGNLNAAVESDEEFFKSCEVIVAPPMLHLAAVHKTLNPLIKVWDSASEIVGLFCP